MARFFGGYAFTPHLAAEAMTFDLGAPGNRLPQAGRALRGRQHEAPTELLRALLQ